MKQWFFDALKPSLIFHDILHQSNSDLKLLKLNLNSMSEKLLSPLHTPYYNRDFISTLLKVSYDFEIQIILSNLLKKTTWYNELFKHDQLLIEETIQKQKLLIEIRTIEIKQILQLLAYYKISFCFGNDDEMILYNEFFIKDFMQFEIIISNEKLPKLISLLTQQGYRIEQKTLYKITVSKGKIYLKLHIRTHYHHLRSQLEDFFNEIPYCTEYEFKYLDFKIPVLSFNLRLNAILSEIKYENKIISINTLWRIYLLFQSLALLDREINKNFQNENKIIYFILQCWEIIKNYQDIEINDFLQNKKNNINDDSFIKMYFSYENKIIKDSDLKIIIHEFMQTLMIKNNQNKNKILYKAMSSVKNLFFLK